MIAVRVTVRDDERHHRPIVPNQPLMDETVDKRGDVDLSRSGVEEQCPVTPEDEIEKRLLKIRTCRLPNN